MAVSWLTALKAVPWADVIEAAPGLAKSAKGFFKRTQDTSVPAADSAAVPPAMGGADDAAWAQAHQRIAALESRLAQVAERQHAAAALIDTLASQNAQLAAAVEVLSRRCRALKLTLWAVVLVVSSALLWVAFAAR